MLWGSEFESHHVSSTTSMYSKSQILDVSLIFTAMAATLIYIHVSLLYIIKGMNTTLLWSQ